MLKINLEKELMKQNRSLVSAKELLLIKEYDSLGEEIVSNESLKRIFGDVPAAKGKRIKGTVNDLFAATKKFDQQRVFHVSQIKTLCGKYYLRFLNAKLFSGKIDAELPNRISQFEIANGVKCDGDNTYIAAPKESFELEERPKDPLMFYEINKEYFYLIHKWGNDLSVFRRLLSLFSNRWFSWLLVVGISALIIVLSVISGSLAAEEPTTAQGWWIGLFIACVCNVIIQLIFLLISGPYSFIKKNEWRNNFKDRWSI